MFWENAKAMRRLQQMIHSIQNLWDIMWNMSHIPTIKRFHC